MISWLWIWAWHVGSCSWSQIAMKGGINTSNKYKEPSEISEIVFDYMAFLSPLHDPLKAFYPPNTVPCIIFPTEKK